MKLLRKSLLALLTALAVAGCSWRNTPCGTPEEKNAFRTAVDHLDTDGMEFAVISGEALQRSFERTLNSAEHDLWASDTLHAKKVSRQQKLALIRMLWQLAGLDKLHCAGLSSKTLCKNPYGPDYIHSKVFLGFHRDANVFLNTFFTGNTLTAVKNFSNLPQETAFAVSGTFDLEVVFQALKSAGNWGEDTALQLADMLPLEELRTVKGAWHLAVLDAELKHFRLQTSASGKKLLPLVKTLLPTAEISEKENQLTVYSSVRAKKIFERNTLKMRERGDFEMLTRGIPDLAFAYAYIKADKNNPDFICAGVKEDNGLLLVSNSGNNLTDLIMDSVMTFCKTDSKPAAETTAAPADTPKGNPAATPETDSEKTALQLLVAVRDNWSEKPDFEGLKASFSGKLPPQMALNQDDSVSANNCIVCFFGKSAVPTHPLAIIRPRPDDMEFKVLYNSGKIETYQLPKANSCRRIISFLHTVHRWDETDFQRLIALAGKFDQKK